jgi:colicin import membrane protein
MTAAIFEERIDPGQFASALLSAGVHLVLLALLIFGVRWQSRPPESIAVELWDAPPVPVVEAPKPPPKVEPPSPPVVQPEPRIEKPEIKLTEPVKIKPVPKPVPQPVLKPVPEPVPKPVVKPEPFKPRVDDTKRRMMDELARETNSLAIDRERQHIREQLAKDAGAATAKSLATWMTKIQSHIRNRINKDVADRVPGNPASIFVVTLLPNCEVLKITLQKSSGNKAYDDEVERAILRASPLPRPDKAEIFDRELRLTFRPKDTI